MLVLAVMVHMLKYAPMESCHSWRSPAFVGTLPLVGLHGKTGLGHRLIHTHQDSHDAGGLWVSDHGLRSHPGTAEHGCGKGACNEWT